MKLVQYYRGHKWHLLTHKQHDLWTLPRRWFPLPTLPNPVYCDLALVDEQDICKKCLHQIKEGTSSNHRFTQTVIPNRIS
jgi:hypothetical protein